ncbi:MAG: SpaH/EbpB family LPXTG-anchored major pilin [Bifidobacteriaceae bacterium]|jgi:fimbrial isopeptide formation D2 family protein/LPXTG-motif cell wall-anchored protein|nr:SpaH/EbpB family LPXTG-anchored major pilin [Bifidobacteriaceae bacterium]
MTIKKQSARCLLSAAACAVTVAAMGMLGGVGAPVAHAAGGGIDVNAKGSITIHKHAHQASDASGNKVTGPVDGSGDTMTDPLNNVGFTGYQITSFDLTKSDSWETLKTFSVPENACDDPAGPQIAGQSFGAAIDFAKTGSDKTLGDGVTKTDNLAIGAYLICETSAPTGVIETSAPFVVTVPFPDSAASGAGSAATNNWIYDVHVYPKNGVAEIDKTVLPQDSLGIGSTATFPVTTKVPRIAAVDGFKKFAISDKLESRLAEGAVKSVSYRDASDPDAASKDALPVDTKYYTVDGPTSDGTVTVTFTSDGLAWLRTQSGSTIEVMFTAKVTNVGDGSIKNIAILHAGTTDIDPQVPSPEVSQNWGDVIIKKVDSASKAPLGGAKFEIYEAADPYPAAGSDCSHAIAQGATPIAVSTGASGATTTTFTTDNAGMVTIPGLFVSDSENGVVDSTFRCYVLKEVAAPLGYVAPQDTTTAVRVQAGTTATDAVDVTVSNTKSTVPPLPLTGSNGTILAVVLGVLTLAGAIFLMIWYARRTSQDVKGIRK